MAKQRVKKLQVPKPLEPEESLPTPAVNGFAPTLGELQATLQALPDFYFRVNLDGIVLDCQPAHAHAWCIPFPTILGKSLQEVFPPQTASQLQTAVQKALATQSLVCIESTLSVQAVEKGFEARLSPLLDHQVLIVIRDITKRQQTEAALQRQVNHAFLLKQITQEIRQSLDTKQIFQTTATQIGQAFCVSYCLIHSYITTPTPQIPLVAEYRLPGYDSLLQLPIPILNTPYLAQVLTQDRAIAAPDVNTDPLLPGIVFQDRLVNLKSLLAIRTSYQGEPNGVIGLYQCDTPRSWSEDEIELLEALAAQVGIALAHAHLLEQETL
ncbi:MAG: GAF domain-containing protein, partial [Leptolyngbyaceae bacterium]|nr:GAF domain-containing protein [Leptolyngbyaceae bacterium]